MLNYLQCYHQPFLMYVLGCSIAGWIYLFSKLVDAEWYQWAISATLLLMGIAVWFL